MKFYYRLLIIFYLTLRTTISVAQWHQTDGPYGSTYVYSIVADDSILVTSTACGYFSKSQLSDGWTFNSSNGFICATQKGDSLFLGTYSGVQVIDLSNLSIAPVVLNSFVGAETIAHSDSCLYAGNHYQGFKKSDDMGVTWVSHNIGLPTDTLWNPWVGTYYETNVSSIEVTSNYIYCGTNKGIYRNTLNLGAWTGMNSGLPLAFVTLVKSFNDTLYTAIGTGLYKSIDQGNNWSLIYTAISNVKSVIKVDTVIYIGTLNDGIYYSPDDGLNWYVMNQGLTDLHINTLSHFDSTLLCGTTSKGVFYFQNNQWINNRAGMICSFIKDIARTDSFVFTHDFTEVYRYESNGSWSIVSPTVNYGILGSLVSSDDTVFLSLDYNIMYSSNDGLTWDNLAGPIPFVRDDPYRIYHDNGRLYVWEDEIMYYTNDLGISWTNISLPSQYCNGFNDFITHGSIPYASACGSAQVVELDNNLNWVLANNGLPLSEPKSFAFSDSALFNYVHNFGMYCSHDSGNTWTYASNGLLTSWGNGIRGFVNYTSTVFVTTDQGIFVTSNFGQNWQAINYGLKNLSASSIKLLNDTLYSGTFGNGVWKRAISDIPIGINDYQSSNQAVKVFPNPASNYVFLTNTNNVKKVFICDLLGQPIVVETKFLGNGIDISKLQNGVYILHMEIGNEKITQKLVISE